MKYTFNKKALRAKYMPFIIANGILCVILIIINRMYNTLSNSSVLSEIFIAVLLVFGISLIAIFFVYRINYKSYKNSYISIYKGVIKFRKKNMQNYWSMYYEYPEYRHYKIEPNKYEAGKRKLTLYGNVEMSLISENEYISKTKSISRITIPAYYDDWQKILSKIETITSK